MAEKSGIAINSEAVAQIAGMAAIEVEGVAGLYTKGIDFKNILTKNAYEKAVSVKWDNGALLIGVALTLKDNVRVKSVAEAVQENIKDKIQTMTGTAVAVVDVQVGDVAFSDESAPEHFRGSRDGSEARIPDL